MSIQTCLNGHAPTRTPAAADARRTAAPRARGPQAPAACPRARGLTAAGACTHTGARMEDLIQQIVSKTGISEANARSAIETVVNFLKNKLPAPLAGQVDSALSSAGGALGGVDLGNITSGLGGLFGKK